ncbi:MAG: radical SAM protein [Akkermansia sp.]|nr:radical SAM protein [Akkermansia sp.]
MTGPLTLTLCLTHQCNLRCRYCYAGRKYRSTMSQATLERAVDIALDEAQRLGRHLDISFFGGEPLLEWELLQYGWQYATQKATNSKVRLRFGLTTNGTLLSQEKSAWLVERDFLIGLSLDGSPAMHNTNRCFANGSGSHTQASRALRHLQQYPSARFKIICVVDPHNHLYLCEGVRWLHRHKVGTIGLNFDYWSPWSDAQFESLAHHMQLLADQVLDSYRAGTPWQVECFADKIRSYIEQPQHSCNRCQLGERELAVSVDGHFFPCSRLVGVGDDPAITFGDVHTGINRARQQFIIATRGNATPECRLCALRYRCINSCGCSNFASSGAINQVSPFLCNLQQLIIRLADTLAETLYAERNPAFMQQFYGQ